MPIYLNDHLAALTAAVELARRIRRENEGGELGAVLTGIEEALAADVAALRVLLERHGVRPSRAKLAGARAAERLGRLKPNGHLRAYSPLSRLLELEGLSAALEFSRALWQALGETERAELVAVHRDRLEPHRAAAARAIQ